MNEEEGFVFDEEALEGRDLSEVVNPTDPPVSQFTLGEFKQAMYLLMERNDGSPGPYTEAQITQAINEVVLENTFKDLVKKGMAEQVMNRDGEMEYRMTPEGSEAAELAQQILEKNKHQSK